MVFGVKNRGYIALIYGVSPGVLTRRNEKKNLLGCQAASSCLVSAESSLRSDKYIRFDSRNKTLKFRGFQAFQSRHRSVLVVAG